MSDRWQLAIDFGTTFTAAAVRTNGRAEVVNIGERRVLRSSILKTDEGYVVGEEAVNRAALSPAAFVRTPKRRLGIDTYASVDGENVAIVDLVAAVFDRVLTDVFTTRSAGGLERIVLTHPAVWSGARTDALVRAFHQSAGTYDVPTVLCPEPAGAAYEYVGVGERTATFAVYDLGGGTLDTAVLQAGGGDKFDLVGMPMGDEALGGEDFDDAIVEHLIDGLRQESATLAEELMTSEEPDWSNARHLLNEGARHAKEAVSLHPSHAFRLPAPVSRDLSLTRDELNGLIRNDIQRSVDILEESIANAEDLTGERITAVYLVGGSSRIPAISSAIEQQMDITCHTREHPKEVVSLGATLLPRDPVVATRPAQATERTGDDDRTTRTADAGAMSATEPGDDSAEASTTSVRDALSTPPVVVQESVKDQPVNSGVGAVRQILGYAALAVVSFELLALYLRVSGLPMGLVFAIHFRGLWLPVTLAVLAVSYLALRLARAATARSRRYVRPAVIGALALVVSGQAFLFVALARPGTSMLPHNSSGEGLLVMNAAALLVVAALASRERALFRRRRGTTNTVSTGSVEPPTTRRFAYGRDGQRRQND